MIEELAPWPSTPTDPRPITDSSAEVRRQAGFKNVRTFLTNAVEEVHNSPVGESPFLTVKAKRSRMCVFYSTVIACNTM